MPVNRMIDEEKYSTVEDNFGDDFDVDARPKGSNSTAVLSGWDDAEKMSTPSGEFPIDFKHSEAPQVIRFLDPNGPFASYRQHFLSNKEGKKSYVCLGANCPLCTELKHKPEDKRAFTIANLSADPISRQILTATPRLFKTLSAVNSSPQGPINKEGMYWSLSRTGVKQSTVYHVTPIKARDLEEDWNINLDAAEAAIAKMEPYPASTIRENSYADLLEIARDLA